MKLRTHPSLTTELLKLIAVAPDNQITLREAMVTITGHPPTAVGASLSRLGKRGVLTKPRTHGGAWRLTRKGIRVVIDMHKALIKEGYPQATEETK